MGSVNYTPFRTHIRYTSEFELKSWVDTFGSFELELIGIKEKLLPMKKEK